ncbi:beta-ketoacyl-ACP synthase III [Bryobacter aggregatus]|uniref:beta-ketoacyl-ACP synthase III n=1 Tax=Bryobacter aggregatus TaxID=360054 RepID=UPI0004E118EF|nr:beta-ketoacyl-ACP synthase III [Bryobacter aggregatus]
MPNAKISSFGCYVPPGVLTNQDLEKMVDTNDEWILSRTGIRTRHIAAPEMASSDLAYEAARICLEKRGLDPKALDAILVSTVTPDMFFPSTACLVQNRLGATGAWGFDISAACSSFVYGLTVGANLIRGGTHQRVLVIGADTMSRILDYTDRSTCILFGDGAGAFLLEATDEPGDGYVAFHNEIDGSGGESLKMPAGGSRLPSSRETVDQRLHYVKQEGQAVFKYAVRKMEEASLAVIEKAGLQPSDIKVLIPHQANMRIIKATAERLGLGEDRVIINIDKYGNTTAGTIPLATRDAVEQGKLQKGDYVLFVTVGAGFTVGANIWRWSI